MRGRDSGSAQASRSASDYEKIDIRLRHGLG
jgi:hypothetical protein